MTLAINNGVPREVVQRMGNWKSRVMVQRYAHLADEELRKAAATVADLVSVRSAEAVQKKDSRRTGSGQERAGAGVTEEATMFLKKYQKQYAQLDLTAQLAFWKAANSGTKEDFDASAAATRLGLGL